MPTAVLMSRLRVPVWLLRPTPGETWQYLCDWPWVELLDRMDPTRKLARSEFRSVEWGKLDTVLATGVDVTPPDSVIYVGPFDKAWEYGGWPKVISAYDQTYLSRSWREVPSSIDPTDLEALKKDYPTTLRSRDGSTLWLSRLSSDDTALATPYESRWAHWIPQDALRALLAVLLCVRPQDEVHVAQWVDA